MGARRLLVLVAVTALGALALATAGGVAAEPGQGQAKGKGKAKTHTKGYKLSRGATTLTLDQAVVDGLTASGATLGILKPAKGVASTPDTDVSFPITNGRVKVTTTGNAITAAAGKINHVGGLSVTEGDSSIVLRNLRIVLDEEPDLTALASVNGGPATRVSVADLEVDLSKVSKTASGKKRWIEAEDVVVKLNEVSAGALNATFGTTFAAGDTLGTADVKTRVVGKR